MLLVAAVGCSTNADSGNSKRSRELAAVASGHRFLVDEAAAEDGTVIDECTANAEGALDCVYDDGMGTTCTYTVTGDGVTLLAELCTGPWGSYTCANTGAAIACTFTTPDGSECTDEWSLDYELVTTTCDYYEEVEPRSEDCQLQEDGTTLCTWGDDTFTCTETLDAAGEFLRGECTDGAWTQVCESADGVVHCALYEGETLLCEDTWTVDGEPISLGCDEYMGGDPGCTDPSCDEPPMTCEPQADGGQVCTQSDGVVTCISTYDANVVPLAVTCTTTDGQVIYACETDPADALLHCVYDDGRQVCEEVIEPQTGEPISSTCAEESRG